MKSFSTQVYQYLTHFRILETPAPTEDKTRRAYVSYRRNHKDEKCHPVVTCFDLTAMPSKRSSAMADLIERGFQRLDQELCGRLSRPGDDRYAATTAIWAKPVGPMPRAVVHCGTAQDVQSAIQAARDCDLPLSVRGGGHDWAGRALCDGHRHRPARHERRER